MGTTSSSTNASTAKQKQMRGWAIERFGDPSRDHTPISLEDLPMPECDRHDVLIRMHGAEIGDGDAIVASGEWSVERPFPIVLGLAGAGTVAAFAPPALIGADEIFGMVTADLDAQIAVALLAAEARRATPRFRAPSRR